MGRLKQGFELDTRMSIAMILVVVGAILLYWSVTFGQSSAEAWLSAKGGAGNDYIVILEGYIQMYRTVGSILLGVSLFALLYKR